MQRRYHCPRCSGLLNPGSRVVLVIEGRQQRHLILLSPEPGNYALDHSDSLVLQPGLAYVLRCPLCHVDLTSPVKDRLVEIHALSADGSKTCVYFSRVFGEHATFFLSEDGVERYGKHSPDYEPVNFFGEGTLTRDD